MNEIKVAFFDFDETVVSFKSMFSFIEYFWQHRYGEEGKEKFSRYINGVKRQWLNNVPREVINLNYYRQFEGEDVESVLSLTDNWIIHEKKHYAGGFYISETLDAINRYKEMGVEIVLVSGAMRDTLIPLACEIGANEVLATRMLVSNGKFTGDIIPPQTIGAGKAQSIVHFMDKRGVDRLSTVAWGDHSSDFDMLEAAGQGILISDNDSVINEARKRGFTVVIRQSHK